MTKTRRHAVGIDASVTNGTAPTFGFVVEGAFVTVPTTCSVFACLRLLVEPPLPIRLFLAHFAHIPCLEDTHNTVQGRNEVG